MKWLWNAAAARLQALGHILRGHDVGWYDDPDVWVGNLGFIFCETCDSCFWSRHWPWFMRLMQRRCARTGHREVFEWETIDGAGSGQWSCDRCCARVTAPGAAA